MSTIPRILSVLFVLALLPSQSLAQRAVCAGKSLITEIERERPDLLEKAEAEFRAYPNGSGIFFTVEKPGVDRSWLLGTIHVPDKRVVALSAEAASAFDKADRLVVESSEVLGSEGAFALVQKHAADFLLPKDGTFDNGFTEEEKRSLADFTAAHGIPYFTARHMQPWFLSLAFAVPPCAKIAMMREPVVDERLYDDALKTGKDVVGLESMDEQFAAIAALSNSVQVAALLEAAKLGVQRSEDAYETMIELYVEKRPAFIVPLLRKLPEYAAATGSMDDMQGTLVDARNLRMRDRLLPILDKGNAFVAVGALHLGGKAGLIELLREKGYTVTRAD